MDDGAWQENYGFRGNASASGCCIYQKDINGDYLDQLTPAMVDEWEITLDIRDPEPEPDSCYCTMGRLYYRNPNGRMVAVENGRFGAGRYSHILRTSARPRHHTPVSKSWTDAAYLPQ